MQPVGAHATRKLDLGAPVFSVASLALCSSDTGHSLTGVRLAVIPGVGLPQKIALLPTFFHGGYSNVQ